METKTKCEACPFKDALEEDWDDVLEAVQDSWDVDGLGLLRLQHELTKRGIKLVKVQP